MRFTPRRAAALLLASALAGAIGIVAALRARRADPPSAAGLQAAPGLPSARPPGPAASDPRLPGEARTAASLVPELGRIEGESYQLYVFSFRVEEARFGVVDLEASDSLEAVLARTGAALVVNGGFFDAQRRPEGLVLVEGAERSPFSPSLGGGVLSVLADGAVLADAQGFSAPPAGARFSIQARPRLVVNGEANTRDERAKAERTALCVLGEGRRLEVVLARGEARGDGPTLAFFADVLVSRGCEQALNLDGGPSTGAAWRGAKGMESLPIRAPIRQAITVGVAR